MELLYHITMIALLAVTLWAILAPNIETGFWVTVGLAGVFIGSAMAMDPAADLRKTLLVVCAGCVMITLGIVSRAYAARKVSCATVERRRATDNPLVRGWTDRTQGAGRPPFSES